MDTLTYLKAWLCSFCVVKTVVFVEKDNSVVKPLPEVVESPPEKIAEYKVSKYALEVISDRVINTVRGKESIQAIGGSKYLLSKEDINLLIEHAVMGTYEDVCEFLSTYKGRELK